VSILLFTVKSSYSHFDSHPHLTTKMLFVAITLSVVETSILALLHAIIRMTRLFSRENK
jgi:hypothetical protein